MIAVLRKDLRLTLDALLPWIFIVAAVLIFGAASSRLRGVFSAFPSQTVLVEEFASLLVLSVGAMTAWITAVVLHGDRRHRASSLAAALPISGAQRDTTRFLSIVLASALPVGVCVWAQFLRGSSTTVAPLIEPGRAWWLPIAMGTAGIGCAWLAAHWSRRIFEIVGLSVVGGAISIAAGLGGAWLYLAAIAPPFTVPGAAGFLGRMMEQAMTSVPAIALCAGGLAGLLGARALCRGARARRRSTVWLVSPMVAIAMLAAPAGAGAIAVRWAVVRDSAGAQVFRSYEQIERIWSLPEASVVEYLRAWNAGSAEGLSLGRDWPLVSVWEIWEAFNVRGRPESVTAAFATMTRVDTAANAAFTLQARAVGRRPVSGEFPELELDAIRRYPRDYYARFHTQRALIAERYRDGDPHAAVLATWANTPWSPGREEAAAIIRLLEYVRDRQPPSSGFARAASDAAQSLRDAWDVKGDDDLPALPPDVGSRDTGGDSTP